MTANDKQVSGTHYKVPGAIEHWDIVIQHKLNYFEAAATKYIMRCRKKNGKADLEKALHFLEKYIEAWDEVTEHGLRAGDPIDPPDSYYKPTK